MKRFLIMLFLCTLVFSFSDQNADSADILYDNFDVPYLNGTKWWPREYVRKVENGRLVLKLGNSSGMGAEVAPGIFRNNLDFANPETIHTIEAEITIKETILDSSADSKSFIRICGYYYNINDIGGATGDIFAMLMIGDRGFGLEAFWEVQEMLSDDTRTWTVIGEGTVIEPGQLQYDIPYNVKLAFEILETKEGKFSFEVGNQLDTFKGPVRKRESVTQYKALSAAINAYHGSNNGFIHGEFDNVYVNENTAVHDDFSSSLDLSKWKSLEWVRELSQGSLKAHIQREGSQGSARTYTLCSDISFLEAKVRLNSESVFSPGGWGVARLRGQFYNATRGPGSGLEYNGLEGDVLFFLNLEMDSSNNLKSRVWVNLMNNASGSSYTRIYGGEFATPIYLDTDYTLSVRFENNQLIFKCDDESLVYQIDTPKYHPYGKYRRAVASKTFLEPGESGYMKAFFDDIRVSDEDIVFCLQDYDFDNDMDGNDIVAFVQDAKDVPIEDFTKHFGRTDCP